MSEPKYSVSEIDRMRKALAVTGRTACSARSYYTADRSAVEDQLRTHMLNGTRPQDLEAAAEEWERWFDALPVDSHE